MILRDTVRVAIWPTGEGQTNLDRPYSQAVEDLTLPAEVGSMQAVAGRDNSLTPFIEVTSARATVPYRSELENKPSYRTTIEWRDRRYILDSPAIVITAKGRPHHMQLLFTRKDS